MIPEYPKVFRKAFESLPKRWDERDLIGGMCHRPTLMAAIRCVKDAKQSDSLITTFKKEEKCPILKEDWFTSATPEDQTMVREALLPLFKRSTG